MERRPGLIIITLLIIILSAAASIFGVVPGTGETYTVTSLWGEQIEMHGQGIYQHDSESYAVQAVAQDWVTLVLGIPLLTAALILTLKGSYKGKLLLTGLLGYFLYTYMSYTFLISYNRFFLLYVSLFSLSLYGFILSFSGLKIENIKDHVRENFPVKPVSIFFIFIALILLFMWLGRIIPSLTSDVPPAGLETYTTLVIQAMDLGIIVPAALIAAVSLLQRKTIGYALSIIVVLKGTAMFSAVSMMAVLMKLNGIEVNAAELIIFPAATLINFVFCFMILRNVKN